MPLPVLILAPSKLCFGDGLGWLGLFAVLEIKPMALLRAGRPSTTELYSQPSTAF